MDTIEISVFAVTEVRLWQIRIHTEDTRLLRARERSQGMQRDQMHTNTNLENRLTQLRSAAPVSNQREEQKQESSDLANTGNTAPANLRLKQNNNNKNTKTN
jgi:hypothetical protein